VNEELRSTIEELEASKEELQSLNEEMHTVNADLDSGLMRLIWRIMTFRICSRAHKSQQYF
jgi:hypothetical protein